MHLRRIAMSLGLMVSMGGMLAAGAQTPTKVPGPPFPDMTHSLRRTSTVIEDAARSPAGAGSQFLGYQAPVISRSVMLTSNFRLLVRNPSSDSHIIKIANRHGREIYL
jgi:hypothetical protein